MHLWYVPSRQAVVYFNSEFWDRCSSAHNYMELMTVLHGRLSAEYQADI